MHSLDFIKNTIAGLFESKPIERAWIFGSYARGEQNEDSDIDILVDYDPDAKIGLFEIARIMLDLENKLNAKIDIVSRKGLYPSVRKHVDLDKILIYERNPARPLPS